MRPRNAILLAAALVIIIDTWVPFGHTLLYPLTLFTTWVHEMGHGLTALVMGGSFEKLEIFSSGAGLAHTRGTGQIGAGLVALGGLLAPPILGTLILALVHGPRRARALLIGLAVALAVSLLLFVRSPAGIIAMPLVAAFLVWAAFFAFKDNPASRVIVAQGLGVLLAFDTINRMIAYVFMDEVEIDGVKRGSDIHHVAETLGGHYLLWGLAVTAFALAMLALGLWWAWGRPAPKEAAPIYRRSDES